MKTSVTLVTGIVSCLIVGMSTQAWAEDLESALENVTISTDPQNAPKSKDDIASRPCTKDSGASCPTAGDDNSANSNAYQATILQQAILNGTEANVTVNGAPATAAPQANILVNGF